MAPVAQRIRALVFGKRGWGFDSLQARMWFVYIVECQDSSLYTGITNNLEKRIKAHNHKKGAKAVKGKLPVKLVYQERYDNQPTALSRESEIKSLKREEKLKLVKKGP